MGYLVFGFRVWVLGVGVMVGKYRDWAGVGVKGSGFRVKLDHVQMD